MTDAEKAYQYFVIAVPENEEQAKAYFWARKALQPTLTPPNEPLTLEDQFLRYKSPEVNRTELSKWLKDGNEAPGVSLEERESMSIK